MVVIKGDSRSSRLESLFSYFELFLKSEGNSPKTLSYYGGHLKLFLDYAREQEWHQVQAADAWAIRQFLAYVPNPANCLGGG